MRGFVLTDAMVATAIFSVAAILFLSSITSTRGPQQENRQMLEDYLKIEEEISELYFSEWDGIEGDVIEISDNATIEIVDYDKDVIVSENSYNPSFVESWEYSGDDDWSDIENAQKIDGNTALLEGGVINYGRGTLFFDFEVDEPPSMYEYTGATLKIKGSLEGAPLRSSIASTKWGLNRPKEDFDDDPGGWVDIEDESSRSHQEIEHETDICWHDLFNDDPVYMLNNLMVAFVGERARREITCDGVELLTETTYSLEVLELEIDFYQQKYEIPLSRLDN